MDLGLAGKVAIVNGGSQGIGYAIARSLAEEGSRVAVTARRAPALHAAAERIRSETSPDVIAIQGDIRQAVDCERIVAETVAGLGRLDILVNNDGAPPLGASLDFDDVAWLRAVEQNLLSVVRMSRAAVPQMRRAGGGSILNIAALSMLQPMRGFGLSVASWAGVMGLAKTLSLETAADRITVNTLCPGLIDTPRLQLVTRQSGQAMEDLAAEIPLGRLGRAQDIAAVAALLVSPRGSYVTGVTLQVDGGLLRSLR
ncbi:MAG: SDR family oxidoreductase [Alphaproteobacteria bacterium]|nr:SDR family oxidoreductase [Alphaproteobacteria bacterium]